MHTQEKSKFYFLHMNFNYNCHMPILYTTSLVLHGFLFTHELHTSVNGILIVNTHTDRHFSTVDRPHHNGWSTSSTGWPIHWSIIRIWWNPRSSVTLFPHIFSHLFTFLSRPKILTSLSLSLSHHPSPFSLSIMAPRGSVSWKRARSQSGEGFSTLTYSLSHQCMMLPASTMILLDIR